jgi:hypothetical protein
LPRLLKARFPASSDIHIICSDEVRFVDPGDNFSRIFCPSCQEELSSDWWGDTMDRAYEKQFLDLAVTVPCCRTTTTLNDLRYEWPAGFARFRLEVRSPGIPSWGDIPLSSLEAALGFLRAIRAHY